MKFIRKSNSKGIQIPTAALKISRIPCDERVELHTLDHVLLVLKGSMTTPELLAVVQQLSDMAADLLKRLAQVCGPCEGCEPCGDCGQEDGFCPYDDLEDMAIDLPGFLRQEAGIPEEAKLCAEVDEENNAVIISAAGNRHDLRDLPPELLDIFAEAGICLGELEEHMILEDIVYGN